MRQEVKIVTRAQWRAAAPAERVKLRSPAQRVVIHHTALARCAGPNACKEQTLSIQTLHMTQRGFSDVGYNFLIGADGTVVEGRGWGVMGAHCKGNNHDSVGIGFMGNYNSDSPSTEALQSVKQLLQSGVSQGFLRKDFTLVGHRDLAKTECPGDKLYAALPLLRKLNS